MTNNNTRQEKKSACHLLAAKIFKEFSLHQANNTLKMVMRKKKKQISENVPLFQKEGLLGITQSYSLPF